MVFGPFVSFLIFVLVEGNSALNPAKAFTVLAFISLLTQPIQMLVHAVSQFGVVIACFGRVQAYLSLEDLQDEVFSRGSWQENTSINDGASEDLPIELRTFGVSVAGTHDVNGSVVMAITDGTFTYRDSPNPVLRDINLQILSSSL